jgi:glycosyltransferase involved in cell wall biosynthesis
VTRINILIPTRGRIATLPHTLKTVLAQDYADLQIIVCDSASQDGSEDYIRSINDERVIYHRGSECSMQENFERALSYVEDGYVGVIGDDDGLLDSAVRRLVRLIEESGASAIRSDYVFYRWPCDKRPHGGLMLLPDGPRVDRRVDGRATFERVLAGNASYTELPYLYSGGFADIAVIRRATAGDGRFFRGIIPDVYSGIAVGNACDAFLHTNEPLCIAGESPRSTGRAQFRATEGEEARSFLKSAALGEVHPRSALIVNGRVVPSRAVITLDAILQYAEAFGLEVEDIALSGMTERVRTEYLAYSEQNRKLLREVFDTWYEQFCEANGLEHVRPDWLAPRMSERVHEALGRLASVVRQSAGSEACEEIVGTPDRPISDVWCASQIASEHFGYSAADSEAGRRGAQRVDE